MSKKICRKCGNEYTPKRRRPRVSKQMKEFMEYLSDGKSASISNFCDATGRSTETVTVFRDLNKTVPRNMLRDLQEMTKMLVKRDVLISHWGAGHRKYFQLKEIPCNITIHVEEVK